ncbi:hypothetical protein SEEM6152_18641, partial [Salmonella enterica subsp. enterica serovar Montevideo str. 556152]
MRFTVNARRRDACRAYGDLIVLCGLRPGAGAGCRH